MSMSLISYASCILSILRVYSFLILLGFGAYELSRKSSLPVCPSSVFSPEMPITPVLPSKPSSWCLQGYM